MSTITIEAEESVEMSRAEGRRLLEGQVRDRLSISLDDFLRRLDAGAYADSHDLDVARLAMLVPFAR